MDLFEFKNWFNALFPAIREHDNWKRPEVIKQNINYILTGEHSASDGMYDGFTIDFSELSNENLQKYKEQDFSYIDYKIASNQQKYIDSIFKMCNQRGIKVILFNTARPSVDLEKINYMDVHKEIQNIADKYSVQFIDYNILYDELGFNNSHFMDEFNPGRHHLNTKGAELTTNYIVEMLHDEL